MIADVLTGQEAGEDADKMVDLDEMNKILKISHP
jgi:hypothetical protein